MFHLFEKEKIIAYIKEELNNIEKALQEERVSQNDFINQVSEYILFAGGKRIRPLLFVLSVKICQNSPKKDFTFNLYRTSLLFEYLHTQLFFMMMLWILLSLGEEERQREPFGVIRQLSLLVIIYTPKP